MPSDNLDNSLAKLRIDKSRKHAKQGGGFGKVVLLLLLAAGGAGAYVYYNKVNAAIEVKVVKPEQEAAGQVADAGSEVLTANGYVVPRNRIEISSKIVGRVQDIFVEQGQHIDQGQTILKIDDEEYVSQVRVAEARVASLKAQLAQLRAGSRPQEVAASQAAVTSAESTLRRSKADLDRLTKLAAQKVIAQQQLDQTRWDYEVAEANVDSARKNYELVKIGPRQEEIDAAKARLNEAEANLEYAKTQLSFTVIVSPVSGTILEKIAEKGELVTNVNFGGTRGAKSSVVSIADLKDLQIETDINENDIKKVKMNQKVLLHLDSHPDKVYNGLVDEIAPQADRQKGTVQVKVKMVDPDETVRPEVNVRATFLEDAPPKTEVAAEKTQPKIWIPRTALVSSAADGPMVYIASDGRAVARKIKLGSENAQRVEVADGLVGTEDLIISPLDKMSDGLKIKMAS